MATAQTIRERTDIDFNNIREEYREALGREPSATARVSALREELRAFYASGGHRQEGQRGIADDGDETTPHLQILVGRNMDWYWDSKAKKWSVSYQLPNSSRFLVFEMEPEQYEALWGRGRPPSYQHKTLATLLKRPGYTFGGNVAEMEGAGQFEAEVGRIVALALDEGKLPDWAKGEGEAMDIIFIAQAEGKSDEWVVDQLAKTKGFKTRFPRIEKFQKENNLTLTEAVTGFLEFEAGVKQAVQSLGQNQSVVTPDLVGGLLDKGHALEVVQDTVAGFRRMKKFAPAMEAFNQVLQANGSAPITDLQDMFDFVMGRASADLYDLYEQSSIQEAAVSAGLGDVFSVHDAIQISRGTDQTTETSTEAAQKAAELLLRLRHEVDTGKFGLDHEELIDVSFGMKPRSGRSEAEIMENINRAVLSAQKSMQDRVNPFTSFTDKGTPQAASLSNLRQES